MGQIQLRCPSAWFLGLAGGLPRSPSYFWSPRLAFHGEAPCSLDLLYTLHFQMEIMEHSEILEPRIDLGMLWPLLHPQSHHKQQ